MALHLYGVTRDGARLPEDLGGRGGGPLRLVGDGELAVIVSDVDADQSAGPKDLLSHARVLEACAEHLTVVPVQFGVLLLDEVQVHEQVLQPDKEALTHLLQAFDGVVQLTVQAFHEEEPALAEVLRRDDRLRALRDETRSAGGAATQGEQVALGQAVADGLAALAAEDRETLLDLLDPAVEAVSLTDPGSGLQVINAALLVARADRARLDQAVDRCRELLGARIRIRYVGPQPPYSFVEPVRSGELVWA